MSDQPQPSRDPSVSGLLRIEEICERFEDAWRARQRPRIEDHLGHVPEPDRSRLLRELLALELLYRRQHDETLIPEEYLQRFPDHAALVQAAFRCRGQAAQQPREAESSQQQVMTGSEQANAGEADQPVQLGRYRITTQLGAGSFGVVYRAYDEELRRDVAIKVPHRHRISRPEDVEEYLAEARILASLDHTHIVPVYDVGRTDDGLCYVVSRWIAGSDLKQRIEETRLSFPESTAVVAAVAEALHCAHRQGLVHRDIKPSNILIDAATKPYVADFGLALKEEDFGQGAGFAGTPAYMSPEQARGEGHRVDGRADIFSLGVIFYELLTGRRPFRAEMQSDLLDQIITVEARPLRQIDDTIPKELERICLKALAKRVTERYPTARDLADDLQHFLEKETPSPARSAGDAAESAPASPALFLASPADPRPIQVVPKGLRSFDAGDADFFLELLPGPRDRDGLPDSLRFWKTRIEEADPDRTFRVGLIYGPSGCGKSSLIKAGLLPRLADQVRAIYIEATPEATEGRLRNGLRKGCPDLPPDLGIVDALAALRRGRGGPPGEKVLLIIDQFEQWLHAHPGDDNLELVQALRHCDGGRAQAVVLVRDDFGMAATRFMRAIEVPIVDAQNFATVDLFDARHARKVLAEFGRAFGALPGDLGVLTREQDRFLDQAVAGLAQDGKVVPVRLALFAEMVRAKPWTASTLKAVGGAEGIGITFLEETFGNRVANPEHRRHRQAARAVLNALLPEQGADIKGHMRTEQELLQASGYAHRSAEFTALLNILDGELRLVTPTDPAGLVEEDRQPEPGSSSGKFYQLTHDFLVPALRDWLTQKQRETRRGRAELRLASRAALWCAAPEKRFLPSWREWFGIRAWTRRRNWTVAQRRMMRAADRYHMLQSWTRLFVLVLIGWASFEVIGYLSAFFVINAFQTSMAGQEQIARNLGPFRHWAKPMLKETIEEESPNSETFAKSAGILLKLYPEETDYVCSRLMKVSNSSDKSLRKALEPYHSLILQGLWKKLEDPQSSTEERSRAAFFLFPRERMNPRWSSVGYQERYAVVRALVSVIPDGYFLPTELKNIPLWPHPDSGKGPLVSGAFVEPLAAIVCNRSEYPEVRNRAMALLVPFNLAQPEVAARLWTIVNNPAMEMRKQCQAAIALLLAYDPADPALPAFGASTVGLTGSPLGHGPFLAASALIPERTTDPRWAALPQELRNEVASILAETNLAASRKWGDDDWLANVPILNRMVIKPLVDLVRDGKRPKTHRFGALRLLSQFRDLPCELLTEIALASTGDDSYSDYWLWRLLPHQKEAIQLMEQELRKKAAPGASEQVREALARRQANAALALLWFGKSQPMVSLLQASPDPQLRTDLIQEKIPFWLAANRLAQEKSEPVKRALILCLARSWANMSSVLGFWGESLNWNQLWLYRIQSSYLLQLYRDMSPRLVQLYRDDPDPGIHSAVDFLFSQMRKYRPWHIDERMEWEPEWVPDKALRDIDHALVSKQAVNGRRWYINREGHTLAVIHGPVTFSMGSPANERGRSENETLHLCRISRSFAIATKEVTNHQFQRFRRTNPGIHHPFLERRQPNANQPVTSLTWFEAAQYCRWLSEQEDIPEDQMCYPPVSQIREGMQLPANYLERTGYRLPTEAEWEFVCRAGSVAKRAYGSSDQMLEHYAWYEWNQTALPVLGASTVGLMGSPPGQGPFLAASALIPGRMNGVRTVAKLMPNDLGLFDVYGNASEWCQDRLLPYPQDKDPIREDREDAMLAINEQLRVLRGGSAASPVSELRSAFRTGARPSQSVPQAGLRVARTYR